MKSKISVFFMIGLVICLWTLPSLAQTKADIAPVQKQFDAYNARNLNGFLECYAEDVIIEDGLGNTIMKGIEEMRDFYNTLFTNSPSLKREILSRIQVGDWIVDEEHVTGVNMDGFPSKIHAAVVYQIKDSKITYVRYSR